MGVQIGPVLKKDFKPQPDQVELAADAVLGKNVIFIDGSESARTNVALCVVQMHMVPKLLKKHKVVFIVPDPTQVRQWLSKCRMYLPEQKSVGLTLEYMKDLYLLLPSYNVFVMTPDIFLRALSNQFSTISLFTLLIFDKCHHTMNEDVFDKVMHYWREKRSRSQILQVVGLTSTVGVTVDASIGQAVNHMLHLIANLDSTIKVIDGHKMRDFENRKYGSSVTDYSMVNYPARHVSSELRGVKVGKQGTDWDLSATPTTYNHKLDDAENFKT